MHDLVQDMPVIGRAETADFPPVLPLETRHLRLDVQGQTLIEDIDLRLDPGGITMVMGFNGAGKSLLLRLLNDLLKPTAGSVLYGGAPLTAAHRQRLAMVFQKPVLLRRSVAANIDFVLKSRGLHSPARVAQLLTRVGLTEKTNQPARLLSGGEAQRLALARALALDPAILFLDEPTANLDPASVLAIEDVVKEASDQGTKIVFVTHDMGQAHRLAADILFLHAGKVAEHRSAPAFFDAPQSEAARAYLAGKLYL
ncbi:MAG: ATP-binding cassette domain-containing protein [Magnetospiraceae bacterium]